MALDFGHDAGDGPMDVDGDSWPLAGGSSRPFVLGATLWHWLGWEFGASPLG
jgi:hypothetical protein